MVAITTTGGKASVSRCRGALQVVCFKSDPRPYANITVGECSEAGGREGNPSEPPPDTRAPPLPTSPLARVGEARLGGMARKKTRLSHPPPLTTPPSAMETRLSHDSPAKVVTDTSVSKYCARVLRGRIETRLRHGTPSCHRRCECDEGGRIPTRLGHHTDCHP